MLNVFLNAVLPIFAVVAFGFIYGHKGIMGADLAQQLNRFVFYFALPVLLFKLIASVPVEQFEWMLLLAYLLAELTLYVLGFLIARHVFKRSKIESLLMGMSAGFANHVFFVLPIAQQLFGEVASLPIVAIITLDSVAMFAGTILILETFTNRDKGLSPLRLLPIFARNPQIIGISLGVVAMLMGVRLNGGFDLFTRFVGDAAAPASLFALGIILAGQKLSNFVPAAVFSGLKLLIMPLVTWVIVVAVFHIDADWANPALLVAAGPSGAMPFVLAMQYKVPVSTIAYTVLISTIASVVSISLMTQVF